MGKKEKAQIFKTISKYKSILRVKKSNSETGSLLIKIGECYYFLKYHRNAIRCYKKAIKKNLSPLKLGVCYDMLGSIFQELRKYKEASKSHNLALKYPQPRNRKAAILTNLGRIYFNTYKKDTIAVELFRKALKLFNPKLPYYDETYVDHCLYCLAVYFYDKRNLSRSKYYYRKVLDLKHSKAGNLKSARKYLKKLKSSEPS